MEIEKVNIKHIGLGILILLIVSLVGMINYGVGRGEQMVFVTLFSVSLAASMLFFEDWFEQKD